MEFLAAVVVIPASFGLALLLQVGALKIILWVLNGKALDGRTLDDKAVLLAVRYTPKVQSLG